MMLITMDTIVIPKGLNVYSNQSGSFADAEGIACIDGKMGNWQKSELVGIAVLKKIFANSDLVPHREIFPEPFSLSNCHK